MVVLVAPTEMKYSVHVWWLKEVRLRLEIFMRLQLLNPIQCIASQQVNFRFFIIEIVINVNRKS
jgi:hypothetical protein